MPTCEVCENEYDKALEVVVSGQRHTFDSRRTNLLLRPLCTRLRHNAVEGPRLKVAVIAVAAVYWSGVTGLALPHCKPRSDRFDATGLTRDCEIQVLT